MLAGRDFEIQDQGHRVAMVNQAFARSYFAGGNPIGRPFTFDGEDRPYEIVGLVGDAKYYEMREATPRTIYFNAFQEGRPASTFVLRTSIVPACRHVCPEQRERHHRHRAEGDRNRAIYRQVLETRLPRGGRVRYSKISITL